ncbi:hypothetical protein COUCH_31315 [Couchioplanes caeruleus]|uniref:hypothetical protein n=1 Tax=Couchioplanes caeruleus TaxID=56438 RepID=UPI0020C04E95|nr:hypothetical protein [Couchioplanes caeruleus]UQU63466.1 hypothetical protein COUCH_31315 [Couchioplanes caeruleus]
MAINHKVSAGALLVIGATAALAGVAGPAQAAYPTTAVSLAYGNSTFSGTAQWQNRSVRVEGTLRVTAGNCRKVGATTATVTADGGGSYLGQMSSSWACNDASVTRSYAVDFTAPADVPGGANYVTVWMNDKEYDLTSQSYYKP